VTKDVKVSPQARSEAPRNAILGAGKVNVSMTASQRRAVSSLRAAGQTIG
jgi:hypothetical protein